MLNTITPPAVPGGYGEALLPLQECKDWLHLAAAETHFDDLIRALRDAAIDAVEKYTNLYLAPRTGIVATFSGFAPSMRLGRGPVATVEVTAVSYVGADGASNDLGAGAWRLEPHGLLPMIGTAWPQAYGAVRVTFGAGYPAGECPKSLLTAAKMFLAHLFASPEAVASEGAEGGFPRGFRTLCDLYRMPVL